MTICPSVVRLAKAQDEEGLVTLLRQWHEEGELPKYSEHRVRTFIHPILNLAPGTIPPTPTIIGVIGPPDDLQASICLILIQSYCSDEWHLGDCWNFVREDCRRSNHAKTLIDFAKACADTMTVPFLSGVISKVRTEAKMRLFRRRFGPPVGGYFVYLPKQNGDARVS